MHLHLQRPSICAMAFPEYATRAVLIMPLLVYVTATPSQCQVIITYRHVVMLLISFCREVSMGITP